MAVRLIFSFDSEDYMTPAAAEAEKWWAEIMSKHGITACIAIVGELARTLQKRGRKDVLSAMSAHEIAYHSDFHSLPPTWAEILDECGWQDGIERILLTELKGISDVREAFGQHPSAWCKPGTVGALKLLQRCRYWISQFFAIHLLPFNAVNLFGSLTL